MIGVANAPVSFGAFELTVGVLPNVPGPEDVLAAIAQGGYVGTELGPAGYLGLDEDLRERLRRFGLQLVGGFVQLSFSEPEAWPDDLAVLAATLDVFEASGSTRVRPVLADAGSPERAANLGRAAADRDLGLDAAGWRNVAEGVARAVELTRSRGFEPTFHPHGGSYVEAPWEIERLLELTEIGLVLDTGHVTLGGGDPVQALREWRDRVDHVHVKDVRRRVLDEVLAERSGLVEAWRRGAFCELGAGDVDLRSFCSELLALGYDGWLVVEQDRIPAGDEPPTAAAQAQARNRRWLAENFGL